MTRSPDPQAPLAPPVRITPVGHTLERLYDHLLHPERAPQPVSTGFAKLDWLLFGGYQPGDLIYLAAHSSAGKTAFALQTAVTWAEANRGVFVVSQEMTELAVTRRLVAQTTEVPAGHLRRGDVTAAEARRVAALLTSWRDLPLYLTDQARDIVTIYEALSRWPQGLRVPALLIVDYLQLTDAPADVRGYEKAEYVSRALKRLAVAAGLTALVLSAVTPSAGASMDDDLNLYSLRGSRGVTFDADVVLLLKRKKGAREATLVVEKARDAMTGEVGLEFREDILRFEPREVA